MLTVGLVGLPNVGKSTLFNALTAGSANVSDYPFTTIDPNVGVVAVPDPRLEELARLLDPEEVVPSHLELTDIAGLVEGASRGEGLGNRFLGDIRAVDAVVHVLRCFSDSEVAHVAGSVDPIRDAGVIDTELLLADLELLERAVAKREKLWKSDPRAHVAERERLSAYRDALAARQALRSLDLDREARGELKAIGLLTGKPLILVANVSESEIAVGGPPVVAELRSRFAQAEVVAISARIEGELRQLEPEERAEFAAELGLATGGLETLAERTFAHLDLIRFYTVANDKLRAWEIERGTLAPQAAGKVHSDMERGFVRARVASFEDLVTGGGLQVLHEIGKLRTEGKGYAVCDGDVIEFMFTPGS